MVLVGLSPGSRSKPSIDWVRNILSKRTSPSTVDMLDRETSHMYSLFWMLIRKRLPPEISDEIIEWLDKTTVPRMNKDFLLGLAEEKEIGEIELDIAGNLFKFHSAELAPPSGAIAVNYSRYVLSLCIHVPSLLM